MNKDCYNIIKNNSLIYEPGGDNVFSDKQRMILCIVPNLSLNGAQTVLRELLHLIQKTYRYDFLIISPDDGEYRNIYLQDGYIVCIRKYVYAYHQMREAIQNGFDAVILNTALVHPYSLFFINTNVPVLWWIHESEEHLKSQCRDMPNPYLLSSNIRILSVTDKVDEAFNELYKYRTSIMHMSIEDHRDVYISDDTNKDRVLFVIPGAYIPIKGQDIMLKAIIRLPKEVRERAKFIFCGYVVEGNERYYEDIVRLSEKIECVEHMGQLSKEEIYRLYSSCDCVVAPSRVDSTPTTIVEAMMFEKITIVSSNCGIAKYITDCINGFVFYSEDELFQRLMLVISDIDSIRNIGVRGREIWKNEFSPARIEEIINGLHIFEKV